MAASAAQSKNWMFTINNPTVFWDHLATPPICPHPDCPEVRRYQKLHPDQGIHPITHISTPAGTWRTVSDDQ